MIVCSRSWVRPTPRTRWAATCSTGWSPTASTRCSCPAGTSGAGRRTPIPSTSPPGPQVIKHVFNDIHSFAIVGMWGKIGRRIEKAWHYAFGDYVPFVPWNNGRQQKSGNAAVLLLAPRVSIKADKLVSSSPSRSSSSFYSTARRSHRTCVLSQTAGIHPPILAEIGGINNNACCRRSDCRNSFII